MVPSSAVLTPKNARGRPVTKLCLALEAFRRTDEGRIRDAKAFLTHFFPQDKSGAKDRIFIHMPNEVRADLLSNWGIRGKKSALRDDDDRVRTTVNDALNAGDIDAPVIEEGITPEILTDWVPLEDWWTFWRGSVLPLGSVRKALALARDLSLFDERWFLEHLALKTQKLVGTDVVCAALSKEQIVAWINAVHASGDASPNGLVAALGWETILAKTAHEGLLFALDALARQIGLAETSPEDRKSEAPPQLAGHDARQTPLSEPPRPTSEPPPAEAPEPPPTPRMDIPARISARPPEPATLNLGGHDAPQTPHPEPVFAKPAPLPTPPGAVTKAESLPPPPPQKSASLPPPPAKIEPIPAPKPPEPPPPISAKPPPPVSAKPPIPITTKAPESTQPAVSKPPPVPKQAPAVSKPPPIPAAAKQAPAVSKAPAEPPKAPPPPPVNNAISKPPARPASSVAPAVQDLPSVIIEDDPFFPPPPQTAPAVSSVVPQAPASNPPNARALFLGAAAEPPPMRAPAPTMVGVAPQALFGATDDVAMPTFSVPPVDPDWAPAKAEPGDMGWDLVHGVTRPMGTNVQPRYNFDDDDEPTSEIDLPTDIVRRS